MAVKTRCLKYCNHPASLVRSQNTVAEHTVIILIQGNDHD